MPAYPKAAAARQTTAAVAPAEISSDAIGWRALRVRAKSETRGYELEGFETAQNDASLRAPDLAAVGFWDIAAVYRSSWRRPVMPKPVIRGV